MPTRAPKHDQVIPDIKQWPIFQLYQDRERFVQQIVEETLQKLLGKSNEELNHLIARTVYLERLRIKEEPWKVDPVNEDAYWKKVRKQLVNTSLDKTTPEALQYTEDLLRGIVQRYADEIAGGFKESTFRFARTFLLELFKRLLNAATAERFINWWGTRYELWERFRVYGPVDKLRGLLGKGSIVLVPTHSSNIDSILIGYVIDAIVGLPAFSYGAGLNLYNTGYTAYFMNRLGAYRVDRRKKNAIYLETLKTMSRLSIERGVESLFFPGGTRSRTGSIEDKLKLGLLGTAVEAQRNLCSEGKEGKVFIVPLTVSYHFVLEAKSLIEQHLKREGEERYLNVPKDESYSIRKWLRFVWQFFSKSSEVTLSFSEPMDVLGNFVDAEGRSTGRFGQPISISDYFRGEDGQVRPDAQREGEYTRHLAERIVACYHRDNIVLSSHLVAFTAFNLLRRKHPRLDIYGVLRLRPDEYVIRGEVFAEMVGRVCAVLREMADKGQVRLSEPFGLPLDALIRDGVAQLGPYHTKEPLRFDQDGHLHSQDFQLLYYYHNRLTGFGLEQKVDWAWKEDSPAPMFVDMA